MPYLFASGFLSVMGSCINLLKEKAVETIILERW